MMEKARKIEYFDGIAAELDKWKKRGLYYHEGLEDLITAIVPSGKKVLEIGCGTGDLLYKTKPSKGVGIDFSKEMVKIAQNKYPSMDFKVGDAERLELNDKFDYILMSDLIGHLDDIWMAFRELKEVTGPNSRIVLTHYNYLWDIPVNIAENTGIKLKQYQQNWLVSGGIENILSLSGYEVIKKGHRLLLPVYIPILSYFVNKYISQLPVIKKLCLVDFVVARQKENETDRSKKQYSCSVIIPCKNEAGNIEGAVLRTPDIGSHTELIFVDGNSDDGTVEKIKEMISKYKGKRDIILIHQGNGKGKGDAVRKGFAAAKGDVLFILDSDLTVIPEDLPKFYLALIEGRGEIINGTRLVYPLEKDSMRFLNKLANKFFGLLFSWLLEQRITDTLCGTKVLFKKDYQEIEKGREYFEDFDPFGDFDLLFGAAKLNLKIAEVPVRYKPRVYGDIKIERFKHGLLLLKMSWIAFKKLKFYTIR